MRSWVDLLAHTRRVASGSFPLYRMFLIGTVLSGLIQLAIGDAPASVSENSPAWFDYVFVGMQTVAGLLALAGLYTEDGSSLNAERLHTSLSIERTGLFLLLSVIAMNVVAVMFYNDGPPAAPATWYMIVFGIYIGLVRLPEIRNALRSLTTPNEEARDDDE